VADLGFQHRIFLKINFIQRYKKYIISTHIYQYIFNFSIEKHTTRIFLVNTRASMDPPLTPALFGKKKELPRAQHI
jgi:hypothetical protein